MATPNSVPAKVEEYVHNIRNPEGEGSRTFTRAYTEAAISAANHFERSRALGIEAAPLAGTVVSIKDLFDVRGEVTTAGSRVMETEAPAVRDAEVVRRLRSAGAIIIGRTNMTEFAFSGLGLNPHYGTPANPWRREERRIPGGSSSGAAISVTDRMADGAIGTDTGGSVRIPAALCGLVGFKPTAGSVPLQGTLPLSPAFDSIGPIANDVRQCIKLYAALSGQPEFPPWQRSRQPRLMALKNYVLEGLDAHVGQTYEAVKARLSELGCELIESHSKTISELPAILEDGGIVAAEAFGWHEGLLQRKSSFYDPRVRSRILRGSQQRAVDHIRRGLVRSRLIVDWETEIDDVDAVIMPTVPIAAPPIQDLESSDEAYSQANLLLLRNPTTVNALDGCAVTLPCHEPGTAPVGLMLVGAHGRDWQLLALAESLTGRLRRHVN
ncbi:amidase [Bradyrhizobium sp. 190]|uniref:amidase n=1 Tax=Bradyrhizobium sp. 190 TaxID=2782658 RepID=UPI001FFAAC19|nr:amidase [Bradyrhizobium sp. 190]MCK1513163.1 amidase [Bradyrhizobium sp. 190]